VGSIKTFLGTDGNRKQGKFVKGLTQPGRGNEYQRLRLTRVYTKACLLAECTRVAT